MWIIKPVASSCGRGIRVLTSSQALAIGKHKKALLQRYLAHPYLIGGKKFDLRLYVSITIIIIAIITATAINTHAHIYTTTTTVLRIYHYITLQVLVSGVDPLRVYVHSEGLTRISTAKYSLNNTSDRFAHLTNYSINKKADNFAAASVDAMGMNGSR